MGPRIIADRVKPGSDRSGRISLAVRRISQEVSVGIKIVVPVVLGRGSGSNDIAGLEVWLEVVDVSKTIHNVERVTGVLPETQIQSRQWVSITFKPGVLRGIARLKIALGLNSHVGDEAVKINVRTEVTVERVPPDFGINAGSSQFKFGLGDRDSA